MLLTVGGKELARYAEGVGRKERLYARVLPLRESVEAALSLGIIRTLSELVFTR